eukprot:Seg3208.5 transcript_id=Seg3208.5/GoldUCD/mRNA.D3Y31 product="hypothetical protein" pseudo=true protein_id=Seg3208.5/GoldUCD/D3Y31
MDDGYLSIYLWIYKSKHNRRHQQKQLVYFATSFVCSCRLFRLKNIYIYDGYNPQLCIYDTLILHKKLYSELVRLFYCTPNAHGRSFSCNFLKFHETEFHDHIIIP